MVAMTIYVSPDEPRWVPTSESDLDEAATSGMLEESHYMELKREIGPGKKANTELARDLAQFAIDGGTLIVGVAENKDSSPSLSPVRLDGLPERIEQIARSKPDPPLPVRTRTISSERGDGYGYVLVHIPISGTAPHMVDHVYFRRGDKTRERLSDADVLRLHRARPDVGDVIRRLIDNYVARDPVPAEERHGAHLFAVAAPVAPRHEMAMNLVHDQPNANTRLFGLVRHSIATSDKAPLGLDLGWAEWLQPRPDGAALVYGLTQERTLERSDSETALEIEFTDDGAVRMFTNCLSQTQTLNGQPTEVLFDSMPVVLVHRIVGVAVEIADRTGYTGPWMIGVHADRIAGLPAATTSQVLNGLLNRPATRWPNDNRPFRETTTASTDELAQMPGAVTQRLVGRFLRTLNRQDAPAYASWLTDPSAEGTP
jgi:hypothetical protein